MTNKEKRDNARNRLVKKIIDNLLTVTDSREVIEGPRGSELLQLMERDAYTLIARYEEKYIGTLDE